MGSTAPAKTICRNDPLSCAVPRRKCLDGRMDGRMEDCCGRPVGEAVLYSGVAQPGAQLFICILLGAFGGICLGGTCHICTCHSHTGVLKGAIGFSLALGKCHTWRFVRLCSCRRAMGKSLSGLCRVDHLALLLHTWLAMNAARHWRWPTCHRLLASLVACSNACRRPD